MAEIPSPVDVYAPHTDLPPALDTDFPSGPGLLLLCLIHYIKEF
jgi:hypothetical protein